MKLSLCIFVLLALAGIAVSQTTISCNECNECPSNTRCPGRTLCSILFSLPSCTRVSALPAPADLVFSGCVIVEPGTVIRSIVSTNAGSGNDCVMLGDGVRVTAEIELGGGNDYLVVGNDVRTGPIDLGDGRDCMTAGTRFRPEEINLGAGNDQLQVQVIDSQVDGSGIKQNILGGTGDDCIVIGPNAKKRSAAELDEIFANFESQKRAVGGSESFVGDIMGEEGRDCIKVNCLDATMIMGGDGDDCVEATASRFHRINGGPNSDVLRAADFDTVLNNGMVGGIFGDEASDTIEASGSRTSPATIVNGGFDVFSGTIDRCCATGSRILSFNCEQPLGFPCVSVP